MKLPANWSEETRDVLVDRQHGHLVQVRRGASGFRDLNAAVLQTAMLMRARQGNPRALLAIQLDRASRGGVETAWARAREVLDPVIGSRISLAVFGPEGSWSDARSEVFGDVIDALSAELSREGIHGSALRRVTGATFFEIAKVLLLAWLRKRGPMQSQAVMREVGCSAPTLIRALRELDGRNEIERKRDRSIELRRLPRQTLDELVARADQLRQTRWFVDRTGKPDPEALLRRLVRKKPSGIAIGGVVAAHHYDPTFDLRGLPRIDLTVHVGSARQFDPKVLTQIDPALEERPSTKSEPVVAVHFLTRAEPHFEARADAPPFADPVEVLLDLFELHLGAQAAEFAKHLRRSHE